MQSRIAPCPIEVTLVGILYICSFLASGYLISRVLDLLNKIPFRLLYAVLRSSTVILVRFLQFQNASWSIEVTLGGMVILVRFSQSQNAKSPIEVTLGGMVMLVRLV